MIVLDASAVLELVLGTDRGRRIGHRIAPRAETLHAPHLLDVEVLQAVRRYARAGEIGEVRARTALMALRDLDATRYAHDVLLERMWALRENMTAYDAAYVALAEGLDCPLLTTDRKLASAPGCSVAIELVE